MEPPKSTSPPAPTFLPHLVPHLFPRKQRPRPRWHWIRGRKSPIARDAAQQEWDEVLDKWLLEDKAREKRRQAALDAFRVLDGADTGQEAQDRRNRARQHVLDMVREILHNMSPPPPTPRIASVLGKYC
ncbi:hypothetical protein BD779DRAFT_1685781 [Infundibulicybe gibba]|nr:hypothetical protein BD779DRAFT_1685781 [Infundibulicybe gibba]